MPDRSKKSTSLSSARAATFRESYVPIACQADAIAIDKSSAFRMDPHVPLVIPEINAQGREAPSRSHRESKLHNHGHADGTVSVAQRFSACVGFSLRPIKQSLEAAREELKN